MRLNLRAKGILAFAALMAYVMIVASVLGAERRRLLDIVIDLEQIHIQEGEFTKTGYAIDHSQLRLQAILFSASPAPSMVDDVALDADLVLSGLQMLQARHPQLQSDVVRLNDHVNRLRASFSRIALVDLHKSQVELDGRLGELEVGLRAQRRAKWAEFYEVYDRMTFIGVATMIFAVLVFGALVSLFFSRIAWDIGKLEARAHDVVAGYRDAPLVVTRGDEIGGLMQAVNRMQSELRKHEQQLELSRQQRFHQEKMAAVGSLATAVAHEINNPIAAIAGIAQSMSASGAATPGGNGDFDGDGPKLILEQTQRISAISRQIAEFARPGSPEPELIDLNRLVRNVCKFMGYDRRLHAMNLTLDLDPEMPAVECVADHLTQVLMNLLINAGDALNGTTGRTPEIRVLTRCVGDQVTLAVQDNGQGMDAATRQRAFEEGFSTKAAGQGLGLGLFLCKTLVERIGGRIEIISEPDAGTTVSVRIPVNAATRG